MIFTQVMVARPKARQVEFTYQATVTAIPVGVKQFDLWLPVPHDTPFQQISGLQIDAPVPYRISTARDGNRILHLRLKSPQQSSFTITMRFTAIRQEHVQARLQTLALPVERDVPDPHLARWLGPDRLVPIDGRVKQWAQEVVAAAGAKTNLEKARAIYNHVVSTVKYDKTGKGWGRGDIYYACDTRRGNCTDFHAIFIGYARAIGIPARFTIGFPLPTERGAGQVSGYHCWAEFYLEGVGWVPVDASEAAKNPAQREYFFGAHDENRIEFTLGRDVQLSPKQAGAPLNFFIYPYAEADGRPFGNIETTFEYRDLAAQVKTQHGQ